MKLFGTPGSPFARKVRIVLIEKNIAHDYIVARASTPDSPVPPFNPLAKIPTLVRDDGRALLKESCRIGGEGLISKKRDAKYRSTRAKTWLKIKCGRRDVFTIVGFVPKRDGIAALRLARKKGRHLEYIGKAGTGFTVAGAAALRRQLDALAIDKPALIEPIRKPDTIWVQPKLKAEIAFTEITADGKLRHASFKGLKN